MSQTYAPLQIYNLFKSCMVIFLIQAVVVLFAPVTLDLSTRLVTLFLNVAISVFLGWLLYQRIYHIVLTYDDKGFTLKKGSNEEIGHKWNEFSKVSLLRNEEGSFSVRLYEDSEFFDLPVSKLKLNPFDFRLEAMQLVASNKGMK